MIPCRRWPIRQIGRRCRWRRRRRVAGGGRGCWGWRWWICRRLRGSWLIRGLCMTIVSRRRRAARRCGQRLLWRCRRWAGRRRWILCWMWSRCLIRWIASGLPLFWSGSCGRRRCRRRQTSWCGCAIRFGRVTWRIFQAAAQIFRPIGQIGRVCGPRLCCLWRWQGLDLSCLRGRWECRRSRKSCFRWRSVPTARWGGWEPGLMTWLAWGGGGHGWRRPWAGRIWE